MQFHITVISSSSVCDANTVDCSVTDADRITCIDHAHMNGRDTFPACCCFSAGDALTAVRLCSHGDFVGQATRELRADRDVKVLVSPGQNSGMHHTARLQHTSAPGALTTVVPGGETSSTHNIIAEPSRLGL